MSQDRRHIGSSRSFALRGFARGAFAALLLSTVARPALAGELPVTRVVLSSSGLGQFTHSGAVTGGETVDLAVRLDQVDDVLKSLTVFDAAGGAGAVSLVGKAALDELFRDLPFDRSALASPDGLLNALVGAEVEITGPVAAKGRVLKVVAEPAATPDGKTVSTRHRLSLVTDKGIVQAVLEEATSFAFSDPRVRAEIDRALGGLAATRAKDRRQVSLAVTGAGKRDLAVGYVVASPIWKTTWRLVLPKGEGKARLQGWAVVENLSGSDWKDVDLTLVSGNPVALTQPLYSAVWGTRTQVPIAGGPRVAPRVDDEAARPAAPPPVAAAMPAPKRAGAPAMMRQESLAMAPMAEASADGFGGGGRGAPMASVDTTLAAEASEASTQTVFHIPQKVTLTSGHTAMVPFVDREIAAKRVWLYQPETDARRPLVALKLDNDGATALPAGIVTAFETAASGASDHVGDAMLAMVPKGATRLLSFALDGRTEVKRTDLGTRETRLGTLSAGKLATTVKARRIVSWEITPPADEARQMILEERRLDGWTAVAAPGEVEVTASRLRRLVEVPAGKPTTVELVQERTTKESVDLTTLPIDEMIVSVRGLENADAGVKQAVDRLSGLMAEISKAEATRERNDQERGKIATDQERIRANLQAVGAASDLGRRYLDQMKTQENRLGDLAKSDAALEDLVAARRKAAEELVAGLKL